MDDTIKSALKSQGSGRWRYIDIRNSATDNLIFDGLHEEIKINDTKFKSLQVKRGCGILSVSGGHGNSIEIEDCNVYKLQITIKSLSKFKMSNVDISKSFSVDIMNVDSIEFSDVVLDSARINMSNFYATRRKPTRLNIYDTDLSKIDFDYLQL